MIGARVGLRIGSRVGLAVGVGEDETGAGVIAGVTRDPLSGKYAPASAAEWTKLMTAAGLATGNPTNAWGFSEPSGNTADLVDSQILAPGGGPAYQSPSAGWSRQGIRCTDGAANMRMSTNFGPPDPSTNSTLMMAYIELPAGAPAAARGVMAKSLTTANVSLNTTGKLRLTDGAAADVTTALPAGVRLIWHLTDITGLKSAVYTEAEEFIGTFILPGTIFLAFGGLTPSASAGINTLYAAYFTGTAAQLTKAQIRTLSQTLGWSVAF